MHWSALDWTAVLTLATIVFLAIIWLCKELTMGICQCKRRLDGKVVLITGGSAGLGFGTALDLARRGAEVVITARDMHKGEAAAENIRRISGNTKVHLRRLDLSSQKDVRRFAAEMRQQFPLLHRLVNNAGMAGDAKGDFFGKSENCEEGRRRDTEDEFEAIVASNFFGQTTLTELLLDCLKASAAAEKENARIVNVASIMHFLSDIDVDNLDLNRRKKPFNATQQYSNSKMAQILYSNELARRIRESNVESVCLHPGFVRTDILRSTDGFKFRALLDLIWWLVGKNVWQGMQTTLHAVIAKENLSGKYLADCRETWVVSWKVGRPDREAMFFEKVREILGLDT